VNTISLPTKYFLPSQTGYVLPQEGETGYLVRRTFTSPDALRACVDDVYLLWTRPGRTNLSHEVRVKGWLGDSMNLSDYALGHVRVTKVGPRRILFTEIEETP
jgi:hypothetical protein